MKRVITALLAALLALSLAACGSRVETKKLAGTWVCPQWMARRRCRCSWSSP